MTPNARTFVSTFRRLAENGIQRTVNERFRIVTPQDEEEVLSLITRDPRLSVRRTAKRLQLSNWSVWRILMREGLHPYPLNGYIHRLYS